MDLVTLPDGEMWLMQPVLEGMISYTDLITPGLRLVDIARMNDALLVRAVNRQRMQDAEKPRGA